MTVLLAGPFSGKHRQARRGVRGVILEVDQEAGYLREVVKRCAGSLQGRRDVAEALVGLGAGVALAHQVAVLVGGHLAGNEDDVADAGRGRESVGLVVRIREEYLS